MAKQPAGRIETAGQSWDAPTRRCCMAAFLPTAYRCLTSTGGLGILHRQKHAVGACPE